jgi:hypothetical protein
MPVTPKTSETCSTILTVFKRTVFLRYAFRDSFLVALVVLGKLAPPLCDVTQWLTVIQGDHWLWDAQKILYVVPATSFYLLRGSKVL